MDAAKWESPHRPKCCEIVAYKIYFNQIPTQTYCICVMWQKFLFFPPFLLFILVLDPPFFEFIEDTGHPVRDYISRPALKVGVTA